LAPLQSASKRPLTSHTTAPAAGLAVASSVGGSIAVLNVSYLPGTPLASIISVTSPSYADEWFAGNTYNITFNVAGFVPFIKIDLYYLKSQTTLTYNSTIALNASTATGYYQWSIPVTLLDIFDPA
jgi:hypothetical protein